MYCPNCGTENDERAQFCKGCGQALSRGERLADEAQSTRPSDKKTTLIRLGIGGGVALVIAAIVAGWLLLDGAGDPPRAEEAARLVGDRPDAAINLEATPDPTATPRPNPRATPRLTATSAPAPTAEPASTSVPISPPGGPTNVRYIYRDRHGRIVDSGFADSVRVSWEPVEGSDYYKVYARAWMYDEQGPQCQLNNEGRPLNFCKLAIGNLKEATYEFESPANLIRSGEQINRHWVAACNRSGCSDLVLAGPAATATPNPAVAATPKPAATPNLTATASPGPASTSAPAPAAAPRPSTPANVWAVREGATIRVSWDLVEGADYYKVYYDDFFDSGCEVGRDGKPRWCEELASRVTETSYVHTSPDSRANYYWVTPCNSGGCSAIDSGNPAKFIDTRLNRPANARAVRAGATIRVSWDLVEGADYYKVYYDDFFDSGCTVEWGGEPSWCEELASRVTETSYVHTSPDRRTIYYWIMACSSRGCSTIDSRNPAASQS